MSRTRRPERPRANRPVPRGNAEAVRQAKRRRRRRQQQRRKAVLFLTFAFVCIVVLAVIGITSIVGALKKDKGENKGSDNQMVVLNQTIAPTYYDLSTQPATDNNMQDTSLNATSAVNGNSFKTSNGFNGQVIDGVTYIDGVLIVNKTYSLPKSFIPQDPDVPVTSQWSTTSLDKTLMENWRKMQSDATKKGLNIYIASGYRSYNTQVGLYDKYVQSDGKEMADTYSSRAGHSEHQSGLCFDLNSIEDSFANTNEGKWVNDNCYKYGFCIRFPKDKDAFTGYQYESWHLRYVGVDLATKLYNNGNWISLEEYFGVTSKYSE